MFERPRSGERAVLVRLGFGAAVDPEDLRELEQLARSAGALPVATVIGRRERPDPRFFMGSGKADEVRDAAAAASRTSSALPLPMKKRGSGRSRRPITVATGCAPAERASCSSSRRSSGSTAAPNPSRTSTARSPLLGRSNTHTSVSGSIIRQQTPLPRRFHRPPSN